MRPIEKQFRIRKHQALKDGAMYEVTRNGFRVGVIFHRTDEFGTRAAASVTLGGESIYLDQYPTIRGAARKIIQIRRAADMFKSV